MGLIIVFETTQIVLSHQESKNKRESIYSIYSPCRAFDYWGRVLNSEKETDLFLGAVCIASQFFEKWKILLDSPGYSSLTSNPTIVTYCNH